MKIQDCGAAVCENMRCEMFSKVFTVVVSVRAQTPGRLI